MSRDNFIFYLFGLGTAYIITDLFPMRLLALFGAIHYGVAIILLIIKLKKEGK